jgi:SHS2 domain-containing protein
MAVRARPRRSWGSFPTTADMGIRATGANASELLEALGLGLFALVTDLRKVRPTEERTVAASAADPESLVVAYLGQLLLLQQVEGFLVRTIHARALGTPPTSVLATVRGEPFEAGRHPQRIEVKAITLHRLVFDPTRGRARVIVDI